MKKRNVKKLINNQFIHNMRKDNDYQQNLKKIKLILLSLILLITIFPIKINGDTKQKNLVNIYFFHSDSCSHCKSESKVLDDLEQKYDNIVIYRYEIHEAKNNEILAEVQKIYDIKTNGVPLTIIGNTAYSGFKDEKSKIEFIKTIEYYSKYSYIDKVGELLKTEISSFNDISQDIPTLEEFMSTYGNYQLIGTLQTDDLDLSTNAILLGALSQLNIIKVGTIFLILLLLSKIGGQRNKILLLIYYLMISFFCATIYIISNKFYTLIIQISILILFMIGLLGYNKNKKRQYLYGNLFIVIAIISNYLENYFCSNYLTIWKKLMTLHGLIGFEKISYYINYILVIIMMNILLVLIFYGVKKQLQKRF